MTTSNLTPEHLRELLDYDPETGIFTNKIQRSRKIIVGKIAGSIRADGYVKIRIATKYFLAHRLAWFYMTNEWPKYHIDHIDGNTTNNCFKNLRDVPHTMNQQNRHTATKTSSSKILGVFKTGHKFMACLCILGTQKYLGTFDTPEKAHAAYLAAKRKYHEGCTI